MAGVPQLEVAFAALCGHSCTVFGRHPVLVPSLAVLYNTLLYIDVHLCIPLKDPAHELFRDRDQKEVVNCIVG